MGCGDFVGRGSEWGGFAARMGRDGAHPTSRIFERRCRAVGERIPVDFTRRDPLVGSGMACANTLIRL